MKNKIFSIIFAVLFGFGAFPQSQEIEYDTIIYFPSTILECPMLFDTAANRVFLNNGGYDTLSPSGWFHPNYHSFGRLSDLKIHCNMDVPYNPGIHLAKVVGHQSLPGIRSFAQPYYLPDLDTAALIIGVAAKIYGDRPPMSTVPHFFLYNAQGNRVDNCPITYMKPTGAEPPYIWNNPWDCELRYYMFQHQHKMQAFSIAYDKNHTYYGEYANVPYEFDHTMAFEGGLKDVPYHHICAFEDHGCYEYMPPFYLTYDADSWVRFDQDTIYSYYRKMQIGFYPIILVPKNHDVGMSEAELSQHCNLVPNPASTYCKVISRYKIERVEVFDMGGRLITEAKPNDYEYFFDFDVFNSGMYVVVIHTPKGKTSKQLIVNK